MGIRKTRSGTLRVLSGLNVTVTDGVAIRTAIISSLLPKLLFLSQFQISCLTVRLGVRRPGGWDGENSKETADHSDHSFHGCLLCTCCVSAVLVLGLQGEHHIERSCSWGAYILLGGDGQ